MTGTFEDSILGDWRVLVGEEDRGYVRGEVKVRCGTRRRRGNDLMLRIWMSFDGEFSRFFA